MKKLLLFSLVAVGGLFVYQQLVSSKAEQDLWTEATDSVPSGPSGN
ncbi:DLW-39 family protein [Streptomyces sp. URMC 129]